MKKLIIAFWFLALPALAANYASPTFNALSLTGSGSTGDVSGMSVLSSGTTTSRSLSARGADVYNVKDFGALTDGTDASTAINAAITYAAAQGGGTVFIPAGTYYINLSNSAIKPSSNVTIRGAGRGATVLTCDDTNTSPAAACIYNPSTAISEFHIRDLTLQGKANVAFTIGSHGVLVYHCTNCSAENIEVQYGRGMAISFRHSDQVTVTHCHILDNDSDGIAVWNTPNAVITDNTILGNADDAISAHTEDADASPPRSGLVIANNNISESQGIKVLGGKAVNISNNVLRRIMAEGIEVDSAGSSYPQGNTPVFSVEIKNNIVEDVWARQDGGQATSFYIVIGGGPKGSSGLIPTLGSANGIGTLYTNSTLSSTSTPGGGWIDVSGNVLVRTLPAVTAISQWGYDTTQWDGSFGANSQYSGAVPESALNGTGILFTSPVRKTRVCDNTIATTGTGITLNASANLVNDDLLICRNNISEFSTSGIAATGSSTTAQRIVISGNNFDADPMFTNANRGSNGTWLANSGPYGINMNVSGVTISANHFRDMVAAMNNTSGMAWTVTQDNFQYGNPLGGNAFSTSNVGLASYLTGAGYIVQEDDNPNSSTFGQQLSAAQANATYNAVSATTVSGTTVDASSVQAASIGNPGGLAGIAITTPTGGSNWWLGSTLGGALPSVVISPSNGQGGGATTALSSIVANNLPGLTGGAGCSVNDTFKYVDPQSGGGLVGGGYLILTATAVSGGSVTSSSASASSGNAYVWAKPASSASTLSAISSTCTTLPSLTISYGNIQWVLSNNDGTQKSGISVTAAGSGYTALPTVSVSPSYTFTSANGASFTTTLSSSMQMSSASGNVQFTNSGTQLGINGTSGAPVISEGALIDGSGVRVSLTTSGYTVPANTSLVRFTQSSTVSSATVTLPTALADGQPIQFVNYAGTVTALTFSPSVNGWTNGNTLAAYTGLRIRWDATSSAWYREQ